MVDKPNDWINHTHSERLFNCLQYLWNADMLSVTQFRIIEERMNLKRKIMADLEDEKS